MMKGSVPLKLLPLSDMITSGYDRLPAIRRKALRKEYAVIFAQRKSYQTMDPFFKEFLHLSELQRLF